MQLIFIAIYKRLSKNRLHSDFSQVLALKYIALVRASDAFCVMYAQSEELCWFT